MCSPLTLSLFLSRYRNIPNSSPVPTHRSASPIAINAAASTDYQPNLLNGFKPSIPPSMNTNASSAVQQPTHLPQRHHNGYANGVGVSSSNNGYANGVGISPSNNGYANGVGVSPSNSRPVYQQEQQVIGRNIAPPLETKGRYSCPRCERKFENKRDCNDHKSRCVL